LKGIEASLESEQAVDSARVAEVKRAIADGSFAVDSEKVADRLITATREFLRAHKQ
jgi:negative regulator of flagellin synthesis FlgM